MSDISTGGDAPTGDAPAAAAPATAAPGAPAAPAAAEEDLSPFGEHAGYIKELRAEAAKYRTSAKSYEDVFGQYADEDREVWFELAKLTASDPAAAAAKFEEIAGGLKSRYSEPTPDPAPAGDPKSEPITAEKLEQLLAEREQKAEIDRQVAAINKQVADKFGEGTPESHLALRYAAQETNGDIDAAIAKVEAYQQGIVDKFLTGKQQQADKFGTPVTSTGSPAGEGKPVKTFQDARAATLARIAASKQA